MAEKRRKSNDFNQEKDCGTLSVSSENRIGICNNGIKVLQYRKHKSAGFSPLLAKAGGN
ncbi:MAG TPA: hypothetical protein H9880_10395 [Candidatus Anaerobutyricum avicola]|nr:hypothetical protein [Candidatus Anaerobutyricum avicola]